MNYFIIFTMIVNDYIKGECLAQIKLNKISYRNSGHILSVSSNSEVITIFAGIHIKYGDLQFGNLSVSLINESFNTRLLTLG